MAKTQNNIEYIITMKHNYFKKLRELQSYGKENNNPLRITETKQSIKILIGEVKKYFATNF